MSEMVQIRSVKQYFNDFIVKGLEGKTKVVELDLIPIKAAILDAFRKEIFGQIVFKLGDDVKTMTKDDLAKVGYVSNILTQSFRKWKRLCILCSEYGLGNFFQLEDLQKVLDDEEDTVILPDPEEDVTDELDGEEPVYLEKSEVTE